MYNDGSTEFNTLIDKSGGNAPIARFTFSDFTIEQFSKLEYYGGSNNSDDIAIGTTNMAYLDVSAMTDKVITNQEFIFEVGMELSDGTVEYSPMGYFTVQKPDSDEDTVNFKAYDRMQKFEKPYTSSLTYPTDSAKVLNELCTICGVELATPITNPITIEDNLQGYTCREVLGYIAGIHGFFACIDRYGKLNLRWYSATPIEKQIGLIWSLTKAQNDYKVEKITLAKDTEITYTSGTGIRGINHSNPYATQAIADSIYASLGGFTYRPCEISMLDDIRLDPWDMLQVTYLDGSVLTIPIMSLSHSFTSGETKIVSVGKSDTENEYSYSGPVTQAMDRMATELLVANRIIATKVDADWVNAHTVTADKLEATNVRVGELEANSLTVEKADLRYANITLGNIDTANIDVANIGSLFLQVGLIDRATIVDGHITGYLDAVEINANSITAGTLVADRILLKGSKNGLLYALNNLGEVTSTVVDTLDGTILTERTITADKLVAKSITADELDVTNIFGNSAVLSTLTSQEAFINAISTNSVVVGASNMANSALNAVNGLEIGGRNLIRYDNIVQFGYGTLDKSNLNSLGEIIRNDTSTNGGFRFDSKDCYEPSSNYVLSGYITILSGTVVNFRVLSGGKIGSFVSFEVDGVSYGNPLVAGFTEINDILNDGNEHYFELKYKSAATISEDTGYQYTYFQPNSGVATAVEYKLLKFCLRKGNKAIDWTPAPEDISVENIYTTGTTTIDGGKITTSSIKAKSIDIDDLFAKNITMDGTFEATSSGWIYPDTTDYQRITEICHGDTPTAEELKYYDLNNDGKISLIDRTILKMMLWGQMTLQDIIDTYGYEPQYSDISFQIIPSDSDGMMRATAIDPLGRYKENRITATSIYYNYAKIESLRSESSYLGDAKAESLEIGNCNIATYVTYRDYSIDVVAGYVYPDITWECPAGYEIVQAIPVIVDNTTLNWDRFVTFSTQTVTNTGCRLICYSSGAASIKVRMNLTFRATT